ncbi:DNA-binding MarR family transcriptional regulator [Catalinimonas alkaloidigena]|uniref:MarR family winged helix-turn-helix transcriptional regulator n=1 Tax=Catalinimonas alkaloidigena TaxID=1075417 RepID=UPI00240694B8|nr:MarR family transcriptional regulator [Catalinimonas alkaloidigena]MDF9798559.1 DNA-binding MarR family transcriptional regulator [Catalinimonas alkaloidigena]
MKLEEVIKQDQFKNSYYKAILNIRVTESWLSNQVNQCLKPFGISQEQYNVLRILKGQYPKPSSLQLITERMVNRMSNATRLVEKLRLGGYVTRKECSSNRRKVDILITEKGMELLEQIRPEIEGSMDRMKNLSQEEAELLNKLLDKFRG